MESPLQTGDAPSMEIMPAVGRGLEAKSPPTVKAGVLAAQFALGEI